MGLLVFAMGVGLLLLTFGLTVGVFLGVDTSLVGKGPYLSNPGSSGGAGGSPDNGEGVSPLMAMLVGVGLKFLGLFVMGYVASLVATKGIQLAHAPLGALGRMRGEEGE